MSLWHKFIHFLKEYFTEDIVKFWDKYELESCNDDDANGDKAKFKVNKSRKSTEVHKTNPILANAMSTGDELYRAIPGGRYGCAQFVKT